MSKSRPTYGPLRCDPTGRRHLLVLQAAEAAKESYGFSEVDTDLVEIWTTGENASGASMTGIALGGLGSAHRRFQSQADMFEALSARLRTETMGLRLYGVGEETFLWDLFGLASAAGLSRQEVVLNRVGGFTRRVRCVHCMTMNEDVHTDLIVCRGCGLTLAVRDHFSRRLSAFMGVHADAEAPGDLPEPRVLVG